MWQRLKNLWKLSEFKPMLPNEKMEAGSTVSMVVRRPNKMATIVDMQDTIERDFPEEQDV